MNKRVLGLLILASCLAIAFAMFRSTILPTAAEKSKAHEELALKQLRETQRSEAALEVAKIVAQEHPERAQIYDPSLRQAREQRLDAMAQAVLEAVATPEPSESAPTAANRTAQ